MSTEGAIAAAETAATPAPVERLPVSVLTGFLGSGKTTLLLVVPIPLAATHQAGAVMLLSLTLLALHSLRGAR